MNGLQEYRFGLFGAGSEKYRLFPSFPLPLCETLSQKEMQINYCYYYCYNRVFMRNQWNENVFHQHLHYHLH